MKAARLVDIRKIEVQEVPEPVVQSSGDVLIKVNTVGICGSDIHYYNTGKIGDQIVEFPWTVGHEMAGTVVETGGSVTGFGPGQRIAVDPLITCGTCSLCRKNLSHTCGNQMFLGCPGQKEGCISDLIVMPEKSCYPIPDSVSFEEAALCEPLSIGMYAVHRADLQPDAAVGILGLGPIGLSVLESLRAMGITKIYASDPLAYRAETARQRGVRWAGHPDRMKEAVLDMEPESLDAVFECCGKQEAFDSAAELAAPTGQIILVGIPEFERFSFIAHVLRRKEITIKHIRRQNNYVQPAIDAVSRKQIQPGYMITHRFSIGDIQQAFELLAGYRDGVIKAVISM